MGLGEGVAFPAIHSIIARTCVSALYAMGSYMYGALRGVARYSAMRCVSRLDMPDGCTASVSAAACCSLPAVAHVSRCCRAGAPCA